MIINEFGEVGIDHLLVERAEEGIVELSSGASAAPSAASWSRRWSGCSAASTIGRIAELRRVVIETTGLADPAPILYLLTRHPYLSLRFRLDGIVTVVDAVNAMATLDEHDEAVRQVAVADRIVLSKTDLAGAAADEVTRADRAAQSRRADPRRRAGAKRPPRAHRLRRFRAGGEGRRRPCAGSRRKRSRSITMKGSGRPDHHSRRGREPPR